LAFSAVSSFPALAACRFRDLAVNCGEAGGQQLSIAVGHARAAMAYFELEEGFLEAGHYSFGIF
jgi:hypothetical protein